ncbi:MAG: hypothetical protein EPO10_10730 [Reyranella sp.]|uniref:hypothetical protein n=1 Tax=Reyranella sp. TaxID=1929291 RepID=UPI0011FF0C61|nr:hypothetical protein [Reyranella sp.]TAJ88680.1 MAG: hypothetical protein EPO41_19895 [Reyranella sp.]TBR28891.1 MAG: hypothetical protein EPO10_10730 [Reyranella sp.]
MPVRWTINSETRLFEAICTGLVEADEIHRMLDVLVGSDALGYRKLFDGSQADTRMGALDVLNIGVRMRTLHGDGAPLGPLAVVIPADKYPLLSRVLGILATPRRPMRVFTEVDRARKWLETAAVRRTVPASEDDVVHRANPLSVNC